MTDLYTLLTLPITSTAFSALPNTDRSVVDDDDDYDDDGGSAMPLRKIPRIDSSSDSASASRHPSHRSHRHSLFGANNNNSSKKAGPVFIQLVGQPIEPTSEAVHNQKYMTVTRCIRILLTRHHHHHYDAGTATASSSEKLPTSFEDIYRLCQFVVTVSKRAARLYDQLKLDLERCVCGLAKDLVQKNAPDATQWMLRFVQASQWFDAQVSLLKCLLTYLDQMYLVHDPKLLSVGDLAFSLFFDYILQNPRIADALRESVQEWITWEREYRQEHPMRPLIKDLVSHLTLHGQYHPLFESFYIDAAKSFYVAESEERASALAQETPRFIAHVDERIREELERCHVVLPESSWNLVEQIVENALMADRLEWSANQAMQDFMANRDEEGIAKLYRLFSRVSGLKVLRAAFKSSVMATVQDIVKDPLLDDSMVQRLLDFKSFADSLVSTVFVEEAPPLATDDDKGKAAAVEPTTSNINNNSQFSYALIDAFQTGFKTRRNKPAEMIAKYMDKAMREPTPDVKASEFEKRMDAVLAIYRFTDDKDVFRTFYHRALAKRLLLGKSASDDDEKMMLKKLKEYYDPEFSMGDHMFNDLALSREMMHEFHAKCDESSSVHKLTVMVLQRSVWPFAARQSTLDLSPSMREDLDHFAGFYRDQHQGRKLEWDPALGTMILIARFDRQTKELSVSLYQGVVLLLFNDATQWSYLEILERTRINDAELRRTLQSLACGKKKVLKKVPVGREVDDGDVFSFNAEFTDPRPKVHIYSIQVKETPEETRRTQDAVEGDRKFYVDAAIVRIMKARKEMTHENLKMAVLDAVKCHFVPDVGTIKQRIQGLVEQEYLKRDEEDMNKYLYVA